MFVAAADIMYCTVLLFAAEENMIYCIVSENICSRPAVYEIYSLFSAILLKGTTIQSSEAKKEIFLVV